MTHLAPYPDEVLDAERCSVSECERPPYASGLCTTHRSRKSRGIPFDAPFRKKRGEVSASCAEEGCSNAAESSYPGALCSAHSWRVRQGRPSAPVKTSKGRFGVCTITGCDKPYKRRGMCVPHGTRAKRFGLSAIQLDMLLRSERCDICRRPFSSGREIQFDHDHKCCPRGGGCDKCFRGVLCVACNTALGFLEDSADRMLDAVAYLRR